MNLYISLTPKSSEQLGDLPLSKSLNLSKFILDKIGEYDIAVIILIVKVNSCIFAIIPHLFVKYITR